jgi:proline racemase
MRWKRILTVVSAHAEGEVGNVVTGGIADVPGGSMLEKKEYFERHLDEVRRMLLFEPRGAPCHAANILLPTQNPSADVGFIILEATKYPPMSGSNTICVATVVLETGILPMQEPETRLVMETPAGLVEAVCRCLGGKVEQVKFKNVPSFLLHEERRIEVPDVGTVCVDIAYGGLFYALVDAEVLGFMMTPDEAYDICVVGRKIRAACNEQVETVHPENPRIRGVPNVLMAGRVHRKEGQLTSKNAVVCGHGRLDRSPCGTGTSARLAVMHSRKEIDVGDILDHESIIGTHFMSEIVGTEVIGNTSTIISTIAGQAWITGILQFGVDPSDPIPNGHTVPDVWFGD